MPTISSSLPCISATAYARSWASTWTDPENNLLTDADLKLLAHVNCCYLSTPNCAPTLVALKQHAQSLVVLIQRLTCASSLFTTPLVGKDGVAGNNSGHFIQHEALDWLNDLSTPYTNDDELHHVPLNALMNQVQRESEPKGAESHCPLKEVRQTARDTYELMPDTAQDKAERVFASHQNLAMHANACLELLDHEYSATGGLMSLLPSAYAADTAQLEAARNTLLGQWLLHTRDLVERIHELEINYANALAVISAADSAGNGGGGLGAAPLHSDTRVLGDHIGLGARPTTQDKLIIVGHLQHAYERIHTLLDRAEAQVASKQKVWWDRGVSGEREWMQTRGGDWYARELVPVDLETRFFRLKGRGREGKIFMMLAIKQNAALAHLTAMETRPTVMSLVTPKWAERSTALERKMMTKAKKRKRGGAADDDQGLELVDEGIMKTLQSRLRMMCEELKMANTKLSFYETRVGKDATEHINDLMEQMDKYKIKVQVLEEAR